MCTSLTLQSAIISLSIVIDSIFMAGAEMRCSGFRVANKMERTPEKVRHMLQAAEHVLEILAQEVPIHVWLVAVTTSLPLSLSVYLYLSPSLSLSLSLSLSAEDFERVP